MNTKYLQWLKKTAILESGIFFSFLLLFLLLNWRLFAIGSGSQLFLYGDNLTTLNNLFYIFSHFTANDIFGTFIGKAGMLGGYPLSEPQNSIFYLPIMVLLPIFKLFHFGSIGLYYELLFLHLFHFILGTFFVYKIAQRSLDLNRSYAFLAGIVYMGLGWNVAWFGTATLSYMIGLLPIAFFAFLSYMKEGGIKNYLLFVLSLSLVLYAGGIVNFFFYILLNFFILFCGFIIFRFEQFSPIVPKSENIKKFFLTFLVAPFLSLLTYSVQLFQTYRISGDIFHSSSTYDYLAFFGTHFYDLIGLIVPKFALIDFGSVTNPTIVLEYSLANILYVGIIPIIVLLLGLFCLRNRVVYLFSFLLFINFLLSFGGAFFIYDATYFFPGNSLFRGHYKYLLIVGVYLSLLTPYVLSRWDATSSLDSYRKIVRGAAHIMGGVLFLGVIASFAAFALKFLQKTNPDLLSQYTLAITFSSYFFRMVLLIGLSLVAIHVFMKHRNAVALLLVTLVLLLDTSINYKYNAFFQTPLDSLTSDTFFDCCKGKTVLNDIDRYSQLYFIPEILGVDPVFQYSAIPNRYLIEYHNRIAEKGGFSAEMLAAAGIDGILTTKLLEDPRFTLETSKSISSGNYPDLYLYNADGNIHNDWGERGSAVGGIVRYYSVKDPVRAYFTTLYKEKSSFEGSLEYIEAKDFDRYIPALMVGKKKERSRDAESYISQVSFAEDRPTYKKVQLNNKRSEGVFFINVPYSTVWKAKVNGQQEAIYNANGSFIGVKVHQEDAVVEIYIDNRVSWILLALSSITFICLCIGLFLQDSFYRTLKEKISNIFGKFIFKKNI